MLDPILVTLIGFTEPPAEIEIPNHPLDESMGSRKVLAAPLCCVVFPLGGVGASAL